MTTRNEYILSGAKENFSVWYKSFGKYLFECLCRRNPNDVLAVDAASKQTLTCRELLEKSIKLSTALKKLSIKKGDVISILCENTLTCYLPSLAALYLGIVMQLVNVSYSVGELTHAFEISKPKVVFCSKSSIGNVLSVKQNLDCIEAIILMEDVEDTDYEFQSVEKLISNISVDFKVFQPEDVDLKDGAILCLSSGTTGLPKCVQLSHENLIPVANFMGDKRYINSSSEDVVISVLPFFHIYGFAVNITAITTSAKVVLIKTFKPNIFLQSVQDYKATKLYLVPPLLHFLVNYPIVNNFDISSLQHILVGAAPLGKDLHTAATMRFEGVSIRQLYGSTEAGGICTIQSVSDNTDSVGAIVSNMLCKVVNVDTNVSLGPLDIGELCFKGLSIMKGYYNNPAETEDALDEDGFYHSGDVGYYDENERFFIVDRIKDLIKYKGFQVAPAELENIIGSHPTVKDCAVIGIDDEKAGQLPLAFVVKQVDANVTEDEIVQFVSERISYQKHLYGGVRFVDAIPRTASGKILRRELRTLLV